MRKKGSTFALAESRDKDLLRVYREIISKQLDLYGRITITGLMEKVVNSPASRYWVSSERACSIILKIDKGETLSQMKKNMIIFYRSLYAEFCTYKNTHPGMPAKHIIEIIIQQPAPCFVVSPRVAGSIIYRMKIKCQRENIQRLKKHS